METPTNQSPIRHGPSFKEWLDTSGATLKSAEAWREAVLRLGASEAAARERGSFAVAVELAPGTVFLAVDRFATRTLCYRIVDGALQVDARADTLARGSADIEAQAVFDYLYFHAIPSPRTVFTGVARLPPGHYALFENGQLSVAPYWVAEFTHDRSRTFASLRDEFLQVVERAVRRQLDGTLPACFLSGGTDSSTVAGMIGRVTGQPARSYSIGFDAQGYDEMAYARLAAKHFGTQHCEHYVTPADLVQHIPGVAAAYDQPFGNSSALPAYCCALRAREDGVSRLLAGDGGDELFGGNSRYAMLRVFGWYQQLPGALRRGLMEPFFLHPTIAGAPLLRKGGGYIRQARTPMPDRLQSHNLLARLGMSQVLTPGFLAQVDTSDPLRQQRAVWSQAISSDPLDHNLAYDWRYTLAESDLPKVRGTVELAGLSVGYPLLDLDLLELATRLPPGHKLRNLKLRWFFKEALRGFLPDEILVKKKHGFGLPFGVWAMQHAPLAAMANDSVRAVAARGIVQSAFAQRLVDTLLPEHPGYYGEMVWILMMLEQWLRHHAPTFACDPA